MTKDSPGTYLVEVDTLKKSFVVKEKASMVPQEEAAKLPAPAPVPAITPEPTPTPIPAPAPRLNWWLIIGIAVIAIAAGITSYLLLRKRKKAKA